MERLIAFSFNDRIVMQGHLSKTQDVHATAL